jgi:hypothetical protein
MVRFLLYIKHHLPFIWRLAEQINGRLFCIIHKKRFEKVIQEVLGASCLNHYTFRQLNSQDLKSLETLLMNQPPERVKYFRPHDFDYQSLFKVHNNTGFLMFGVFNGDEMAGYFFLRCFWTRKCFVGRLIDKQYEGKGIGKEMNKIMYNTGWKSGFRVLSTISRDNSLVMRSHANNPSIKILKKLKDNYMLVEFLQPGNNSITD